MNPTPRAETMVAMPQPIMVPVTISILTWGVRFRSRATISGPPTMAVNITRTCWMPKSAVFVGPG